MSDSHELSTAYYDVEFFFNSKKLLGTIKGVTHKLGLWHVLLVFAKSKEICEDQNGVRLTRAQNSLKVGEQQKATRRAKKQGERECGQVAMEKVNMSRIYVA